jgi:Uma2 family endonuclease
MTFEEFLEWSDKATRAEWVNGKVVLMPSGGVPHADTAWFVMRAIADYVEAHDLGRTFVAGVVMRMPEIDSARIPDALFYSNSRTHMDRGTHFHGAADLVVEIISPGSRNRKRDTHEKFFEYERAGVLEYWLIDPHRKTAQFYISGPDGRFKESPIDHNGIYRSTVVPGFFLRLSWLWQFPMPKGADIRRELGIP